MSTRNSWWVTEHGVTESNTTEWLRLSLLHLSSFWCHLPSSGPGYHSAGIHFSILVFSHYHLPDTQLSQRNCSDTDYITFPAQDEITHPLQALFVAWQSSPLQPCASLICPLLHTRCMLQPNWTPCSDVSWSWHLCACLHFHLLKKALQSEYEKYHSFSKNKLKFDSLHAAFLDSSSFRNDSLLLWTLGILCLKALRKALWCVPLGAGLVFIHPAPPVSYLWQLLNKYLRR